MDRDDDRLRRYGVSNTIYNDSHHEGWTLARICSQHMNIYQAACERGILAAQVSGRFIHEAADNAAFPAVGDVVLLDVPNEEGPAIIHRVLKRTSAFVRKAAGTSGESQVIAANVDTALICMSMNRDFNLRRLERYIVAVWNSGATPVVVLTKSDLCQDVNAYIDMASSAAPGVDVVALSATQDVPSILGKYIKKGKTTVFVGSSGVGKSTLINLLMGADILPTREITNNDKGRHTTTNRQMLLLPGGGIVIDTPGLRALEMDGTDLSMGFSDIERLAENCRFSDCSHTGEPGCAVQSAIVDGVLSKNRLDNYKKLQREIAYQGLDAKRREHAKMENMFGSMGEMKRAMRELRRNRNR